MKTNCVCRVLALGFMALLVGCGGDTAPPAKTIAVDGKLSIDGKPFGPAALSLVHSTDETAMGLEGRVKEDGTIDSLSYRGDGGDPGGTYKVILSEDSSSMSLEGVPKVKVISVDIQVPAEGQKLTLNLAMESDRSAKGPVSGGPDPSVGSGAAGAAISPGT